MDTIRLIYPDWTGGGLETYYLGAQILELLLPKVPGQKTVRVPVSAPDGRARQVAAGICGLDEVLCGIRAAKGAIARARPGRIITAGGTCLVSLAPFDYLHGLYPDAGIIWLDAHPDVSGTGNGYPYAHAMVLGTLLGQGPEPLASELANSPFDPDAVLYVGLQQLHGYQAAALDALGIGHKVHVPGTDVSEEIRDFAARRPQLLVHFDIDVLDPRRFHATYFASPDLHGDGSGGGVMTLDETAAVLRLICESAEVTGFTIAEYLPFEAEALRRLMAGLPLFAGS